MRKADLFKTVAICGLSFALLGCGAENSSEDTPAKVVEAPRVPGTVDVSVWPKVESPVGLDAAIEARITDIMSKMELRHKVGQVIQGDIGSLTPED